MRLWKGVLCVSDCHCDNAYPDRVSILVCKFFMSCLLNNFNTSKPFEVVFKILLWGFLSDPKDKDSAVFTNVLLDLFIFFLVFLLSLVNQLLKLVLHPKNLFIFLQKSFFKFFNFCTILVLLSFKFWDLILKFLYFLFPNSIFWFIIFELILQWSYNVLFYFCWLKVWFQILILFFQRFIFWSKFSNFILQILFLF